MRNRTLEHWSKPKQLAQIEEWARKGLSVHEIANNIGIAQSTLYTWRSKSDVILEALSKGQDDIVEVLENALIKRAVGYDIEDITYKYHADGTKVKTSGRTRHIYPDVTALKFALINKSKGKWTDRVDYTDNSAHDKLDKLMQQLEDKAND